MANTSEARSNTRRWQLLLLNVFFVFGTLLPVYDFGTGSANTWELRRGLLRQATSLQKDYGEMFSFAMTICGMLLVILPIVHVLKLVGVLGEKLRNSRLVSWILSLGEFICTLCVPLIPLAYSFGSTGNIVTASVANYFSPWLYVWVLLTVYAIVISMCLKPTAPIFKGLIANEKDVICKECGYKNPFGSDYCIGCGKPLLSEQKRKTEWFCPSCGTKNSANEHSCTVCGKTRPKGY